MPRPLYQALRSAFVADLAEMYVALVEHVPADILRHQLVHDARAFNGLLDSLGVTDVLTTDGHELVELVETMCSGGRR